MIAAPRCAEFAEAIYDPKSHWDREWVRGDIRVGGAKFIDCWLLVWRGTRVTSVGDMMRDADCRPYHDREIGNVHRGFYDGMMTVANAIDHDLAGEIIEEDGHSLGGAMALLHAARCRARSLPVAAVTTFAPPRIAFSLFGDVSVVERLLEPLPGDDWAHPSDDIPLLPPVFRSGRKLKMLSQTERGSIIDPLPFHAIAGYRADVTAAA